jgi:hypothetical protein
MARARTSGLLQSSTLAVFSRYVVDWNLTTAAAMYREMDMGLWLEQAEAEAELGPPHRNSP